MTAVHTAVRLYLSDYFFRKVFVWFIKRERVLEQTCHLAHLSVGRSVCLEGVLWQNG